MHQIFAYEYLLLTLNGLFALISCLKYSCIHKFAYTHNFSSIPCHKHTHTHTHTARNQRTQYQFGVTARVCLPNICMYVRVTEKVGVVFTLQRGRLSLVRLLICPSVFKSKQSSETSNYIRNGCLIHFRNINTQVKFIRFWGEVKMIRLCWIRADATVYPPNPYTYQLFTPALLSVRSCRTKWYSILQSW